MKNVNSVDHWNNIWQKEGLKTWRKYPMTYSIITDLLLESNFKKVLDVGCGNGVLLSKIKCLGFDVFGVDISDVAINQLKQYHNIDGIACKVPPVPKGYYDCIVASEFLEHFNVPDKVLLDFVKHSDSLIVAVPNNVLGNDECNEHYQKFNKNSLRDLLERYYINVEVLDIVDSFDQIQLPVLIAKCRGVIL